MPGFNIEQRWQIPCLWLADLLLTQPIRVLPWQSDKHANLGSFTLFPCFPSLSARLYIYTFLFRNTKRIKNTCAAVHLCLISDPLLLPVTVWLLLIIIHQCVCRTNTQWCVCARVVFYQRDKNLSVYLCATNPNKSFFTIFRPSLYCLEWNQVCLTSSCGH